MAKTESRIQKSDIRNQIDLKLDPNQILIAEFNYAAQTAFQATEDRVRVFNYVLASIGTLLGTFFLPSLTSVFNPLVFSMLFLVLCIFGLMSLFKLAKLRTSWVSSVKAMLQVKEFYINNTDKKLEEAFRWKAATLPRADKVWSVAFLMALTTMFLNSLTAAGSLYLFMLETGKVVWLSESVLFALILLIVQIIFWFRATR
jgi:hypothetical protein